MDTVRADHVGAYGYYRPTTPNVDAFAERSVLFENAVSQASWTLPAHGSMMTGLYPGRLGVIHYPAKRKLPDVDTLASAFKRAGYATGGFTGGGFVSAHFGFNRGFEVYTTEGRRFEHNIDEALTWLEHNKQRRFFMFFHGYDSHRPYYSHPMDKQAIGLKGKGPVERRGFCTRSQRDRPSDDELAAIVSFYDASIHMGDRLVGRFLDSVRDKGLMDNTAILITSDHGEEFFDHGNCDHVRFLYREIVNVPFILWVPGLSPQGERIADVIPASLSVTRTLLDVVGIEHEMPGVTLVPMLRGARALFGAVFSEADSAIGALGSRGATIAMTGESYKLISYLDEGADEAYDLRRDPHEHRILPEKHDAYSSRHTLRAWHASMAPKNVAVASRTPRQGTGEPKPGELRASRSQAARSLRRPERASGARLSRRAQAKARLEAKEAETRDAKSPKDREAPAHNAAPPAEEPELAIPKELEEELRSLGYLDE